MIISFSGECIIMGDFNVIRDESETLGSQFNLMTTSLFNQFIKHVDLHDIHLGGDRFTWSNKWGSKFSKLDRLLVSDGVLDHFSHLTGLVLEEKISDHRPVLLLEHKVDYDPLPFRLFHSWLGMDGYDDLAMSSWVQAIDSIHLWLIFKKKLQCLKSNIRSWNYSSHDWFDLKKKELHNLLDSIDTRLMVDDGSASLREQRVSVQKDLNVLDHLLHIDLAQKVKVHRGIEGDENSGFFHGTVNRKRYQIDIRGVFRNGFWVDDPGWVKEEFQLFFIRIYFEEIMGLDQRLMGLIFLLSRRIRSIIFRSLSLGRR